MADGMVDQILDGWFGEPPGHSNDEAGRLKYLYEPLRRIEEESAGVQTMSPAKVAVFLDRQLEALRTQRAAVDKTILEVELMMRAVQQLRAGSAPATQQEPTASVLVLKEVGDETMEVIANGQPIATLTHDEHGWAGMRLAENLLTEISKVFGFTITRE